MQEVIRSLQEVDLNISGLKGRDVFTDLQPASPQVTAATSFNPEMFDRVGSFVQQRNARELFQHLRGKGELNILDLGCADGEFAKEVMFPRCGKTGQLIGVDLSVDMIRKAQSHITPELYDRVQFLIGDLTKLGELNMPKEFFDVALSNFVLHWLDLKQSAEFLSGLKPHLSHGAELLLCFPIEGTYQELISSAADSLKSGKFKNLFNSENVKHFNFPSPGAFKDTLLNTGYEIIDIYQHEVWRPFRSAADLGEWFLYTMSPFTFGTGGLSREERSQIAGDIVNRYIESMDSVSDYPKIDGVLFVRDLTLVAHAQNNIVQ